jgi:hypothetical protein
MTKTTEVEVYEPGELQQRELSVDQLIERREKIEDAMQRAMKKGVHYGTIPGISKPTLFKPGAEMLCTLFMFDPEYESETMFDDEGHFHVKTKCTLYHMPTGNRIASGEGYCTTAEKRYAQKKGGVVRPKAELPELFNTVVKMANKRALVAAVLNATAASDVFTQDVEDKPSDEPTNTPLKAATKADLHRELTLSAYAPEYWTEQQMLANARRHFNDETLMAVEDLSDEQAQAIIVIAKNWRKENPPPEPEVYLDQEELA